MPISIKNKRIDGFSLIELLIVISIFTIITTVALFDQGKLNSNVLLTNLSYDVALAVREAQSYGVGVKYSASTASVVGGYGVYLNMASPEVIIVFHDVNNDGAYSESDGDTTEKTYQFLNQRGNKIWELCGIDTVGSLTSGSCQTLNSGKKINEMSVTFKRPDPEAKFKADGSTFSGPAYIVLKSQDGTNCRAVVIDGSGQIRVEGSDSIACKTP